MDDDYPERGHAQTIDECQYEILFALRDLLMSTRDVVRERYGSEPENIERSLTTVDREVQLLIGRLH